MDFCKLLHTAQKNDKNAPNGARYYSTKYEPPKKLTKKPPTSGGKELSANVKKFLERKEAEERKKAEEAQRKKEELLALRSQDKKAVKRVSIMLKSTKSANKSVIDDATDNKNTAVTLVGPDQPDEDDYGYVSQEASDLYSKMMEKYKSMPEEPKFKKFEKKVSTNLASTKDRVKAALEREKEEAMLPHKRKRKRKETAEGEEEDGKGTDEGGSTKYEEKEPEDVPVKLKPKPRPAPPPMSFTDLLKIAEKKQHEPIIIEQKPKDEEKLLTKKQRRLAEQERDYWERKEARERGEGRPTGEKSKLEARLTENPKGPSKPPSQISKPVNSDNRLHSTTGTSKTSDSFKKPLDPPRNLSQSSSHMNNGSKGKYPPNGSFNKNASSSQSAVPSKIKPSSRDIERKSTSSPSFNRSESSRSNVTPISSSSKPPLNKPVPSNRSPPTNQIRPKESDLIRRPIENQRPAEKRPTENQRSSGKRSIENQRPGEKRPIDNQRTGAKRPLENHQRPGETRPIAIQRPAERRPEGQRPAERRSEGQRLAERRPEEQRPAQRPKEALKKRPFPLNPYMDPIDRFPMKKPAPPPNRRVIDDYDDEDEYDSELDDFIDDGPEDDAGYSSVIKEIFGYDKSRFRDADDDVDDMETSFAQQMKEEVRSAKIGIMEDLEDIEKEREEKRRKVLMKKKMMKR